MTLISDMAAAARRALRRRWGVWPLMEAWNKLRMAPTIPALVRCENREVALAMQKHHGLLPEARIACIIPTYRRHEGLIASIRSVLDQELKDFVIVVVDDGGGLPPLPEDPRIFSVSLSRNYAMVGFVRNVGIRLSRSEFVAFLDDDNTWTPKHLEVTVDALEKGADLVYTAVQRRLPNGEEFDVLSRPFDRRRFANETSWVDANSLVLRRSACKLFSRVRRTKGTFPKEDWEFVWRVSRSARVQHVPVTTVEYLVNPESFYTSWT